MRFWTNNRIIAQQDQEASGAHGTRLLPAIDQNGPELDLQEKDETGEYHRSIIRLIDNTEYKFDTSQDFV